MKLFRNSGADGHPPSLRLERACMDARACLLDILGDKNFAHVDDQIRLRTVDGGLHVTLDWYIDVIMTAWMTETQKRMLMIEEFMTLRRGGREKNPGNNGTTEKAPLTLDEFVFIAQTIAPELSRRQTEDCYHRLDSKLAYVEGAEGIIQVVPWFRRLLALSSKTFSNAVHEPTVTPTPALIIQYPGKTFSSWLLRIIANVVRKQHNTRPLRT